jgi:hypothetical protein
MTIRTLTIATFLFALPANAYSQSEEPFHNFRLAGSVLLGTGHNESTGQTVSANVNASAFFPLVQNFGLRASATFLSQPNLDATEGGGAAFLSIGGGADYTIGFGDSNWGLGLVAGVEGAPWGFLDPGGFSTPSSTIRGVVLVQELALRKAIRIGMWELGVRADEFFGNTTITNVGLFFRISFRLGS